MNSRAPNNGYGHLAERLDRLDHKVDFLSARVDRLYHAMVFGGLGAVITILLGVAGINISYVSGMTQAFQAGQEKRIAGIEAQTVEVRKSLEDLRRTSEAFREEMRAENDRTRREARADNDQTRKEARSDYEQTRKELRELRALIERRLPPGPRR